MVTIGMRYEPKCRPFFENTIQVTFFEISHVYRTHFFKSNFSTFSEPAVKRPALHQLLAGNI